MEEPRLVMGGAFFIESISPKQIFTSEEFTEEQRLTARAATEFAWVRFSPKQMPDDEILVSGGGRGEEI
jgi:hypothetical protein